MFSVSTLNTVLNAVLWFSHAMISLVAQRVYVAAARLQLATSGSTHGTDSNETNFLHWIQKKLASRRRSSSTSRQKTAGWAILIMVVMFTLLPAELVLESGLDVRHDCQVVQKTSNSGVCATPWRGFSIFQAGALALVVNKIMWLDHEWDFVREGSSTSFWRNEVRRSDRSIVHALDKNIRYLARNCVVHPISCTACGTMTVKYVDQFAGTVVLNTSLVPQRDQSTLCFGQVNYDGVTGAAHWFCEEVVRASTPPSFGPTVRFATRGIETVLDDSAERNVMRRRRTPWKLALASKSTRLYNISCETDGLASSDLTRAISLMRTAQIGIYPASPLDKSIESIPPLTASDVLKGVFALKVADRRSNCTASIEVYKECGVFNWRVARYVGILYAAMLITWLVLWMLSARYSHIDVPHDSITWRKYAYEGFIHDRGKTMNDNITSSRSNSNSNATDEADTDMDMNKDKDKDIDIPDVEDRLSSFVGDVEVSETKGAEQGEMDSDVTGSEQVGVSTKAAVQPARPPPQPPLRPPPTHVPVPMPPLQLTGDVEKMDECRMDMTIDTLTPASENGMDREVGGGRSSSRGAAARLPFGRVSTKSCKRDRTPALGRTSGMVGENREGDATMRRQRTVVTLDRSDGRVSSKVLLLPEEQ